MSGNQFHPRAVVQSQQVGPNAAVMAFARIYPHATVGRFSRIGDGCSVENDAVVGRDVVIAQGVRVAEGTVIEDRVYVGPNVAILSRPLERAAVQRPDPVPARVCEGASLGANVTVLSGVSIGRYASVEPGSVVADDVPAYALVGGNPARLLGWVCRCGAELEAQPGNVACVCGAEYVMRNGEIGEP